MDVTVILLIMTVILLIVLIVLVIFAITPRRASQERPRDESELDQIKHQVEYEGEQEAMEELMPYKPPRLDAPRQRKRF